MPDCPQPSGTFWFPDPSKGFSVVIAPTFAPVHGIYLELISRPMAAPTKARNRDV